MLTSISHSSSRSRWLFAISIIFILLGIAIAYQPVMFNFFCSDDFYILGWLNDAKHNPAILFQEQYSGTPYYRPLLNVLLYLEYLLCGINSCAFRIISLIYQLVAVIVLGFVLKELSPSNLTDSSTDKPVHENKALYWSLFSVGLFLLYPLHTEPINWFVCTTEVIANLFVLTSILFYLYWRKKNKYLFGLLSCIFAACAFLTKEATVTLPAILLTYELLLNNGVFKTEAKLLTKVLHTLPHWLLLAGYLVVRKMATGKFIGSWNNAVFHFPDNQSMYKAWWQSLKMIFVPISSTVFNNNSILSHIIHAIWLSMLAGLVYLTIRSFWKNGKHVLLILFLLSWFFICLLPMYKLLLITPDLLDARYGYLASIPLCALLMFGLASVCNIKLLDRSRYPIFFIVLAISCFILRANNMAWAETGKLTNNLISEFSRIHKEISGDPLIYFVNIPISYNGVAIAGLKSIDSMNHRPFLDKDYNNCFWLLNSDQSLPIGIMHNIMEQGKTGAYFYYFNMAAQHFYPVPFLKSPHPESIDKISLKDKRTFVFEPRGLNCWSVDSIILKASIQNILNSMKSSNVELTFFNDAQSLPSNTNLTKVIVPLDLSEKDQTLVFQLRGLPAWSLGGCCHSIEVAFPKGCSASVDGAFVKSMANAMPQITFAGANYVQRLGQLELSPKYPQATLIYDASFIANCAAVALEVIGPNEYFKELNTSRSEGYSLVRQITKDSYGQIKLDRNLFPASGSYKVRLRPVDKQGSQTGLCSDHFIIAVTK